MAPTPNWGSVKWPPPPTGDQLNSPHPQLGISNSINGSYQNGQLLASDWPCQDDAVTELMFKLPLSEFALDLEVGWKLPNINPSCKCCAKSQLMRAVKAMAVGLE